MRRAVGVGPMLATWARFLLFRAGREEMGSISWRAFLGPGLVATWVVGMGRYLVLFLLTFLSVYAIAPLSIAYLALVIRARQQTARARRAAA